MNTEINDFTEWGHLYYEQVLTRLDGIMFGVLGAYLSLFYNEQWLKHKKTKLALGVILIIVHQLLFVFSIRFNFDPSNIYFCVFSFSIASVATLLSLPALSSLRCYKGIFYKPITYISLVSYSMYLTNLSIVKWKLLPYTMSFIANKVSLIQIVIEYSLYWAITLTLSIILFKYFETPILSIRDSGLPFKKVSKLVYSTKLKVK